MSDEGSWADESDWELGAEDVAEAIEEAAAAPPVVAVVGRPNVGKSTLVNRILGRREAVVQDVPGVARDRVSYDAVWLGRRFVVQDTGGWEPDAKGLQQLVAEQASVAMRTADAIIFVVDVTVGATTADEAAARLLQRSGKPVFLAANKVDTERGEADAAQLWSLGLGQPYSVSAMHGRGVADLLDTVIDPLTEQDQRVLSMVIEAGRALVLAFNKWDLVDEDRRYLLEREIERELAQLLWAPRVNISAMTGRAVQRLVPALETALESWDSRISTGRLNTFLKEVVAAHPPPVRGGKQPRILFATQATARPPPFVLFTTGFLEAGYRAGLWH